MSPDIKIIEKNFLNSIELEDIKNKIHSNIDLKFKRPIYSSNFSMTLMPSGLCYYKNKDQYNKDIKIFNTKLENLFDYYYKKIQTKINKEFKIQSNFSSEFCYPGFQILGPGKLNYPFVFYHYDIFLEKCIDEIHQDDILTFLIPIQLPETGAGLRYIKPGNEIPHAFNSEFSNFELQNYHVGDLISWEGNIFHSIAPFILKEYEYRIVWTFYLWKSKNILFW